MSAKDDGGPAFPHDEIFRREKDGNYQIKAQQGMSLRDWYAGMALQGLIASGIIHRLHDLGMDKTAIPDNCAAVAFEWADAMITALKESP